MDNFMWKWIMVFCLAFSANLSAETKILAFAGSAREDSANKKLIAEATQFARQVGANVTLIDLKDYQVPFYDADFEIKEGMPTKAKQLRQLMLQSDIILIASPEYNGSLSALLKNTIDWASRNEEGGGSRDAFKGKKFALMSASPGSGGGNRGLVHLRTILENLGGIVIPQQVTVPDAYNAFDAQGHIKNENLKKEIQQLVQTAIDYK
jgi:chromate reductase, NAD(P)H dehydrogenase (quinone)